MTIKNVEPFQQRIDQKSPNFMYKPDSKKVGTLYKLWIKTECNDVEVSNVNILFRI